MVNLEIKPVKLTIEYWNNNNPTYFLMHLKGKKIIEIF